MAEFYASMWSDSNEAAAAVGRQLLGTRMSSMYLVQFFSSGNNIIPVVHSSRFYRYLMMPSQQMNNNPVTLNQPCRFCKVLELNDSSFSGESKISDNGTPFLDFGEIKQTK
ncbi:uncharacterized protein BKA55DRAFT_294518 [Fusarium redolens]|uniref:Uncharacterized protein n=1 Tax=Fusarium redolens TaxID=48865 RepID=A0A9P9HJZ6_FUSRE|nr:uncharacterized protein BKA55DRAFT_294518 [Fusarium redolens]KAH7258965.1 hypothetical protein BKA55DRAFT_294518 [Fusarium redolens]